MSDDLDAKIASLEEDIELISHIISHSLRDPLRENITLYENIEKDNVDYKIIENIINNDSIVLDTATILLDYIRISSINSKLKKLDCNEIIEDSIMMLAEKITKTGAEINYSELPNIMGRKKFITDLFFYIIDNAISFTDNSEVPKVDISVDNKDGFCEFTIIDNGHGLEEEYEDLSFILFQKFNSAGNGVGLSMAKKIVESHGGKISLDGRLGEGARIVFSLPMSYD